MTKRKRTQLIEWRFSLWFALLSPLLGALAGVLFLFVFAR